MRVPRICAAIVVIFAVAGCATPYSEAPVATNFPTSTQKKLQAASHWNVIAADVSGHLTAVMATKLQSGQPLYVESTQATPFNRAIANQLISSLVSAGYVVAKTSTGAVRVDVDTQVVEFSSGRSKSQYAGLPTALTVGVWALAATHPTGAGTATALIVGADAYNWFKSENASGEIPKTEIIINVSVSNADRYIARSTNVYYVTDTDKWLYEAVQTKNFSVTGGGL